MILSLRTNVCGDANLFPFWTSTITDSKILKAAIKSVSDEGLDKPFPLKYTSARNKQQKMIFTEIFAGSYEQDAIWATHGSTMDRNCS